jgi:hypothetical protein
MVGFFCGLGGDWTFWSAPARHHGGVRETVMVA